MKTTFATDGIAPLTHLGLIRARGADVAKFLQSQLTNDVATLDASNVRLAGFCSAKGRLQASFIVWRPAPDEVLLACAVSVLPATLKRLSMFVLRAQCRLSDASAEFALLGALGSSAQALLGDAAIWRTHEAHGGMALRLPDVDGVVRCLLAAAPAEAPPATSAPDAWRLLDVRSGIPTIEAATVDQFVPQMLNYEIVGGVDFQKGCYPGQEIVARSQYRGTIKRRMFLFECDAAAAPGDEVFHELDATQPAGMVVNAAPTGDGAASIALVEVKLSVLDSGALHLIDAHGALLRSLALPYALPNDSALPA
jgi:tRNA-modifying protein YgfZ